MRINYFNLIVSTFGGLMMVRYINSGIINLKYRNFLELSYDVVFFMIGCFILIESLNALYLILDICKTEYTDKCRKRHSVRTYDCQKCDDWDIIKY